MVRQKMLDTSKSFTKLFLQLDADKDGLVSPGDVARFLARCNIVRNGVEEEIEGWFAEFTDRPKMGLDYPQLSTFLQKGAQSIPQPIRPKENFSDGLTDEQLERIRSYFRQGLEKAGGNLSEYHRLLAGGSGRLYGHALRDVVESGEKRPL